MQSGLGLVLSKGYYNCLSFKRNPKHLWRSVFVFPYKMSSCMIFVSEQ